MFKSIALGISLALVSQCGTAITINRGVSLPQHVKFKPVAMLAALPPNSTYIPQTERNKWTVTCDSEASEYNGCKKAIDGLTGNFWQSTSASSNHTITIDLQGTQNINALSVTPRGDSQDGRIAAHKVYLSKDGSTWGQPVAFGTWFYDEDDKFASFEPQQARYIRLEANSVYGKPGTKYAALADLNVWTVQQFTPTPPSLGRWGPTIDFPIVPVGVWVDPLSGNLITFSSYAHDRFDLAATTNTTLTTTWNRATNQLSQRRVSETHHDMFCPGMSFDVNGRMIISGGETAQKTSIYNPNSSTWSAMPQMNIARGYQGSVTTSDGKVFVIGGSWSPNGGASNWNRMGGRTGEIFDPIKGQWSLLNGTNADEIETTEDWQGEYRQDNHAWLMGWKNGSIFHAGPSKNMHWINTAGDGSIKDAGARGNDDNAMCGVAVMYDAAKGKILTAGGGPQYQYWDNTVEPWALKGKPASKNAFVITLGDSANSPVQVKTAGGGLQFPRMFHHGVVLPSGQVFVSGGQALGMPFTDQTPALHPELYSPDRDSWTTMAPNSVARTYHSVGLLLPDATVLIGGGGLCGECDLNHYDAQIYTPPYLLTSSGALASRPTIKSTSSPSVRPGGNLTFVTDRPVKSASLIRYGGSTHSLNNDQRRIALDLKPARAGNQYSFSIPADSGVAIPGYWMLFALDAQGVPSEAKNVQILVGSS